MPRAVTKLAATFAILGGLTGGAVGFGMAEKEEPDYAEMKRTTVKVEYIAESDGSVFGHCTGFAVNRTQVVTAGHCTARLRQHGDKLDARIITNYGKKYKVEVAAQSFSIANAGGRGSDNGQPKTDLGLLTLKNNAKVRPTVVAQLGYSKPAIGDKVFVSGWPAENAYSITEGEVFSLGTSPVVDGEEADNWLAYNAQTFGGNSGGPVFNKDGEVVGVVSHGMVARGGAPIGYDYAVSADRLIEFLHEEGVL